MEMLPGNMEISGPKSISLFIKDIKMKDIQKWKMYTSEPEKIANLYLTATFFHYTDGMAIVKLRSTMKVNERFYLLIKLIGQNRRFRSCFYSSVKLFHEIKNCVTIEVSHNEMGEMLTVADVMNLKVDVTLLEDSCENILDEDAKAYYLELKSNRCMKSEPVCDIFKRLWHEKLFTDFTFTIENVDFHVHKSILAAQSEVFERIFLEVFHEKSGESITIENTTTNAFQQLLEYLYIRKIPKYNNHIFDILRTAYEFNIDKLVKICEMLILPNLNSDNAMQALNVACLYDNEIMKKEAFVIIQEKVFPDKNLPSELKDRPNLVEYLFNAKNKMQHDIKTAEKAYDTIYNDLTNSFKENEH